MRDLDLTATNYCSGMSLVIGMIAGDEYFSFGYSRINIYFNWDN